MRRRSFIQAALAGIASIGLSKSAAASQRASVNGVPYPYDVRDMASFETWLGSIDRPVKTSTEPWAIDRASSAHASVSPTKHRELFSRAMFRNEDPTSLTIAETSVFQCIALGMFAHLVSAPNGTIVWRVRPEQDTAWEIVPSDLSKIETREQAEKRCGLESNRPISLKSMRQNDKWHVDFVHDRLVHMDDPFGTWRWFKAYVRYSVVVDGVAI